MPIETMYKTFCPNCNHMTTGVWSGKIFTEFYDALQKCRECNMAHVHITIEAQGKREIRTQRGTK